MSARTGGAFLLARGHRAGGPPEFRAEPRSVSQGEIGFASSVGAIGGAETAVSRKR